MEKEKNKNQIIGIFKSVMFAYVFTVISLSIFAILLVNTNIKEELIPTVIIIITFFSILLGCSIGIRKFRKNGMLSGGIVGVIYIFIMYLISSILNSNFSLDGNSIIMICLSIVGGIVGGVIGINTSK